MEKKLWFKAKRYGWGWTPVTWQGWVAVLVYVAILIRFGTILDAREHSVSDFLLNFVFYAGIPPAPMGLLAFLITKPDQQECGYSSIEDKIHQEITHGVLTRVEYSAKPNENGDVHQYGNPALPGNRCPAPAISFCFKPKFLFHNLALRFNKYSRIKCLRPCW
jgi:hypothetical protein